MGQNARAVSPLAALIVLGGCALAVPIGGAPVGEAAPGGMPSECAGTELAFAGEATLAEIGMRDFVSGPEANRPGFIQVTAGPIVPAGLGPGIDMEPARWVCVQWPDGSAMGATIPDDWQLPAGIEADPDELAAQGGVPLIPIALAALAVAAIGVTLIAFRSEQTS